MKKTLLLLVLMLFSASIALSKEVVVMRTRPFLQAPVDNGMTVTWLTNYPTLSHVEFGEDENKMQRAVTLQNGQVVANNKIHQIRLKNLKPNTKYYYRAISKVIKYYGAIKKTFGKEEKSELYSFTTPPEVGEKHNFTAVVFNDLHQNIATAEAMQKALNGEKYDFVIFNGDCINDPKDQKQAVEMISKLNDIVGATQIPVIYLRGNHEIRNAYSIWLYDILQTIAGERSYGAFSWGDTRLMLLDNGEDKADEHPVYYGMNDFTQFREDQKQFIIDEIGEKVHTRAAFRVLVHHIPIYGNYSKYNPCGELWSEVLNDAKIDCAINAHTHKVAFHPIGALDNQYPVLIGGGPKLETACITVIRKQNEQLIVEQIGDKGVVLNTLIL